MLYINAILAFLCLVRMTVAAPRSLPAIMAHKRSLEHQHHYKTPETLYAKADVVSKDNGIKASFEFTGYTDGRGTFVKIEAEGLSALSLQGPFLYHIHTNPVGDGSSCTEALGHLDPLAVTESLLCDPAFPEYCQEGDLSGKHGTLNGTADGTIEAFGYTDDYLRFFPQDFSLLGRSVVIHSANKTRLACGNIISVLDGTATSNSCHMPTRKPSTFVTHYPTQPPYNPPQTAEPFVGTVAPNATELQTLPFPLANKAISIKDSLNVNLTVTNTTVYVNGTQESVMLPLELPTNASMPFRDC